MASRAQPAFPFLSPWVVTAAGLLAASLVGSVTALGLGPGIGLLVAICYAPLVLVNLPLGIALWIPIASIHSLPVVWIAPTAALTLIALAWLGTLTYRRGPQLHWPGGHRRLSILVGLLLIWAALSAGWATKPGTAFGGLWTLFLAALIFFIISSTISTPRQIALVSSAVVAGAVLSVVIGLVHGGLGAPTPDLATPGATEQGGRLQGGAGDPNYLAAILVPAVVLAGGLLGISRKLAHRWALVLAIGLLAIGFAATESRGGLIGAGVAIAAALIFFKGRRVYVVAGFSTFPIANYFAIILDRLRSDISLLASNDAFATPRLVEMKAEDCLVAFTFPRYASATHRIVMWAKENKAKVVAVTDSPISAVGQIADVVLLAASAGLGMQNSLIAPLAVANALLANSPSIPRGGR